MGPYARASESAAAHPRGVRLAFDAAFVTLAVLVGLAVFPLVGRSAVNAGPLRLGVGVGFAWPGTTIVEVPPFGRAEADTHAGPLRIDVRIDEVDVVAARRLLEKTDVDLWTELPADIEVRNGRRAAARIALGGTVAAMLATAVILLAVRRSWRVVAAGAAIVLAVCAGSLALAAGTWRADAFREPTLRGPLTYVPTLANLFADRVATIERLRDEAAGLARDVAGYYADDRSFAVGGALPDTVRVLHVSDLHLDPVGARLESEFARAYDVSLVIDTGDISVFGSEPEAGAVASLIGTETPRVFVPGNHDSPAVVAQLKRMPNVRVIAEPGVVEAAGLRIFGVPDPISRGFDVEPDPGELETATRAAADAFDALMASDETTPDVVAIHNPRMERPFLGRVPAILSGHTHSERLYVSEGTVRLNSGTTGGMPYAPSSGRPTLPYSVSVLYYTREVPRRLVAVDQIEVAANRSASLTRHMVDESLAE